MLLRIFSSFLAALTELFAKITAATPFSFNLLIMCCNQAKLALFLGGSPYFQRIGSSFASHFWLKGGLDNIKSTFSSKFLCKSSLKVSSGLSPKSHSKPRRRVLVFPTRQTLVAFSCP